MREEGAVPEPGLQNRIVGRGVQEVMGHEAGLKSRAMSMLKLGVYLIHKPDYNEGARQVAEEGQHPVAGQLKEVAAALEQGSWHVRAV